MAKKKTTKKAVKKPIKKVVKKTVKKTSKKAVKKPTKKPTKKEKKLTLSQLVDLRIESRKKSIAKVISKTPLKIKKGIIYRKVKKTVGGKTTDKWEVTSPKKLAKSTNSNVRDIDLEKKQNQEFKKKYSKNVKDIIRVIDKARKISKHQIKLINEAEGGLIKATVHEKGMTDDDYCVLLRKERSSLYSKRSRRVKSNKKSKTKSDKKAQNKRDIKAINVRLEMIKIDVFKCTSKYATINKEINTLEKQLQEARKKSKDKRISTDTKKLLKIEIRVIKEYLIKLKQAKDINVTDVHDSKRGTSFTSDEKGDFEEEERLWVLEENFRVWASSGMFDDLVIDGAKYSIKNNLTASIMAVKHEYDKGVNGNYGSSPMYYAKGVASSRLLILDVEDFNNGIL